MQRRARILAALVPALLVVVAQPAHAQAPKPIDLPGARVFPENLTITKDSTAYVGSVGGGVLRVTLATGKVTQWIKPGAYGSGSVFGVLADPINGLLWTCNNDLAFANTTVAGADKGVYVKAFDLKTGAGRLSLKMPGEKTFCNDFAVAKDGTVYVTNTSGDEILRWRKGATALEPWSTDPAYDAKGQGGLDGIAFGADGNLYINNFRSHILARVEMKSDGSAGKVTVLQTSRPLNTPDGLRPLGGMRFIQAEGSTPGKIAIVTVSGDTASIEDVADGLSAPSAVELHGDTLWYVEPSLGYIFNAGMRDKTPPLPFRVTPIALPKSK